jgi:hypothetical protein
MRPTALAAAALGMLPLPGQEPAFPRHRVALGFGSGIYDYATSGTDADGHTDATPLRALAETCGPGGHGAGFRLDDLRSDKDLFEDRGVQDTEADNLSAYAWYGLRVHGDGWICPLRAGLLYNVQALQQVGAGAETAATTFALQLEVAPEQRLAGDGSWLWTAYAQLGVGFGDTTIRSDSYAPDYETQTTFGSLELGTRVRLGVCELSLLWLGRSQMTDPSNIRDGAFAPGTDALLSVFLVQMGVAF